MATKSFRTRIRRLTRRISRRRFLMTAGVLVLFVGSFGYAIYMDTRRQVVDPITYRPLLELIARVESHSNYNAHFGNAANKTVDFTDMTLAEVLQWQDDFVAQGNPSNAVGRYQIISTTLRELISQLGLDTQQKFDPPTQDTLAIALLERRGSEQYVNDELSRQEFAANLAKEWAALPRALGDRPEDSYYAGDGLNAALVSTREVLRAIEPIKPL